MRIKPGTENANENNLAAQPDPSPCLSGDRVFACIISVYALFSTEKADATKT